MAFKCLTLDQNDDLWWRDQTRHYMQITAGIIKYIPKCCKKLRKKWVGSGFLLFLKQFSKNSADFFRSLWGAAWTNYRDIYMQKPRCIFFTFSVKNKKNRKFPLKASKTSTQRNQRVKRKELIRSGKIFKNLLCNLQCLNLCDIWISYSVPTAAILNVIWEQFCYFISAQ